MISICPLALGHRTYIESTKDVQRTSRSSKRGMDA